MVTVKACWLFLLSFLYLGQSLIAVKISFSKKTWPREQHQLQKMQVKKKLQPIFSRQTSEHRRIIIPGNRDSAFVSKFFVSNLFRYWPGAFIKITIIQ